MSRHHVSFADDVPKDDNKGPPRGPKKSGPICPNCGSSEIEEHPASGSSICTECGVVVEENEIVSSVEFLEGADGSSSMIGQFVSGTSAKASGGGGGLGGARYGFSRDSREVCLANGKRRIQDVASRLRLGPHFVDSAHRLFTIAVEKNFIQGRRRFHVVAACLYIACRQEKSQHMLIDFSDALCINVYTLGACFLKFRRLLGLPLEIIDPALFVYRFAAHLDLEDKANAVAMTALRLVARMKRDWIVSGRRPAGICAAALLISARAHGFTKHNHDVTRVLRVCGMTVQHRVKEFEVTPSANLTLDQFSGGVADQIEAEKDPPVFTRNRLREARALAIQEKNVQLLTTGALDDPHVSSARRASQWRRRTRSGLLTHQAASATHNNNTHRAHMLQLYTALEDEMEQATAATPTAASAKEGDEPNADGEQARDRAAAGGGEEEETAVAASAESTPATTMAAASAVETPTVDATATTTALEKDAKQAIGVSALAVVEKSKAANDSDGLDILYPRGSNGRALVLPHEASAEELQAPTHATEGKINLQEWKQTLPAESSQEMEELFRNDSEVREKEAIFNQIHKDYLDQQQAKEMERLSAAAASKNQEEEDVRQAAEHALYANSTGRKQRRRRSNLTTQEALQEELASRKVSRKINYEALRVLFDDSGNLSTENLKDGPGAPPPSEDVKPVVEEPFEMDFY